MKKQINFNSLSKQILDTYKENNRDWFDELLNSIENLDKTDIINRITNNEHKLDEFECIKILRAILAECSHENIDLNKYFPLFVEI